MRSGASCGREWAIQAVFEARGTPAPAISRGSQAPQPVGAFWLHVRLEIAPPRGSIPSSGGELTERLVIGRAGNAAFPSLNSWISSSASSPGATKLRSRTVMGSPPGDLIRSCDHAPAVPASTSNSALGPSAATAQRSCSMPSMPDSSIRVRSTDRRAPQPSCQRDRGMRVPVGRTASRQLAGRPRP